MAQSISQEAIGATGLPGATAASRHAGATTSGAPTTGTFAVGDYVVDQTGAMYVCTVAGTPGTWQLSGVSVNENIAGKNVVINGGMDIWQRGTSFTNVAYGAYTADRWYGFRGGNVANMNVSQVSSGTFNGTSTAVSSTTLTMSSATWNTNAYVGYTVTSGSSTATVTSNTATVLTFSAWTGGTPSTGSFSIVGPINLKYASRIQRTSGDTSTAVTYFLSSLETNNSLPLAGKTVTISFWARAGSNLSNSSSISYQLQAGTGTDQNQYVGMTGVTNIVNNTVTLTSSWQQFSATVTTASFWTQFGVQIFYSPSGTAGANDYFDITGVQLEIAPQATPFSRAGGSIGGELALCQRYYQRFTTSAANQPIASNGLGLTSGAIGCFGNFPVSMRVAPTSLDFSNVSIYGQVSGSLTQQNVTAALNNPSPVAYSALLTGSGFTIGYAYAVLASTSGVGYLGFSAEL